MKLQYIFIFALFLGTSCNNTEEGNTDVQDNSGDKIEANGKELTPTQKLSKRWVLVKRTSLDKKKVIEFDKDNSSVITFFEDNGYFRVYDSLTDHDKTHGVKKIEQRQSGQWEFIDGELILRYTRPDTVIVEKHEVQKLEDSELILKSVVKDQINKYVIKKD